jgi:DNA helicase IV
VSSTLGLPRTEAPTTAVIALAADGARIDARLRQEASEEELDRLRVLDPRTAKGLEFDDVVVVAPEAIAAASVVGYHQLYVAVTRATRSLTLVASPDGEVPGADACDAG